MSAGHHHGDAPAPVGTVVRWLQGNPGLRMAVQRAQHPIVNRQFRIPYLAGSSIDGRVVYIDSQTPERFAKSNVEPDETYPYHELPERYLMVAMGFDYLRAHRIAHGIEQYCMKLDGISDERIAQYEKESWALVDIDENVKLPPEAFPSDLYLGPYESDEDKLDERLLPLLRQAQMIRRAA